MKQTLLPPTSHRSRRGGAILFAATLLAVTSVPSPAAAIEPSLPVPSLAVPAATPSPTATPSPSSTPSPTATAPAVTHAAAAPAASARPTATATTPSPSASRTTTQAAAQSAPAAAAVKDLAAMAAAIGPGGAEMGQRSARVNASSLLLKAATQSTSIESLTTQGTWSPSFGIKGMDVSGHQTSVNWQSQGTSAHASPTSKPAKAITSPMIPSAPSTTAPAASG